MNESQLNLFELLESAQEEKKLDDLEIIQEDIQLNDQDDILSDTSSLNQVILFELKEPWEDEWRGMPEFIQENLEPIKTLMIHLEDLKDLVDLSEVIGQQITEKTKSIWFPKLDSDKPSDFIYTDEHGEYDES